MLIIGGKAVNIASEETGTFRGKGAAGLVRQNSPTQHPEDGGVNSIGGNVSKVRDSVEAIRPRLLRALALKPAKMTFFLAPFLYGLFAG